jgi:hypothetical protein
MKKNFLLGNLLILLGIVCAFGAMFFPFANGIKLVSGGSSQEMGRAYDYIFGVKSTGFLDPGTASIGIAKAAWILILIGAIFAILVVPLAFVTKKLPHFGHFTFGQVLGAFAALLLIVGGILYFFVGGAYATYYGLDKANVGLGIGFILSAIAGILGGVFCLLPLFVTLKK